MQGETAQQLSRKEGDRTRIAPTAPASDRNAPRAPEIQPVVCFRASVDLAACPGYGASLDRPDAGPRSTHGGKVDCIDVGPNNALHF